MPRAEAGALAALLLLGGCWQAPAPPAQVREEPDALPPGLWEVQRSLLSQRVGAGAPNLVAEPTPKTETRCLAAPVTRLAVAEMLLDVEGAACTPSALVFAGGKLEARLSCTPPPTHRSNMMALTGSYSADRLAAEAVQQAVAVPPNQDSETRTALDARRLGDC